MNKEYGLFDIMEKLHNWHNAKQMGYKYSDQDLKNLRLKIIELAGLDWSELLCRCDDIDGCCFSVLQGETDQLGTLEEVKGVDRYCSDIRNLIETIGD